jgi:hypothetical protein
MQHKSLPYENDNRDILCYCRFILHYLFRQLNIETPIMFHTASSSLLMRNYRTNLIFASLIIKTRYGRVGYKIYNMKWLILSYIQLRSV